MTNKLGTLGYLFILFGLILMYFSPLSGFLCVFGAILVAIAWINLGRNSKEKVMIGNGVIMLIILILSFLLPIIAVLFWNFKILSLGLLLVLAITYFSLLFDLLSHLKAYLRYRAKGFALAFILRLVCFLLSIFVFYSFKQVFEINSFSEMMNIQKLTPQISVFGLFVILANLFSAIGFSSIREK